MPQYIYISHAFPSNTILIVNNIYTHLKSIKVLNASFNVIRCGNVPLFINANIFPEKVVCSAVFLYKLFCTTAGMASFFSSITIRMPSRSVSSRRSEIPSSFLSLTSSAIFSNSANIIVVIYYLLV